jgi:2-keto-4-pentenoate hydratase/2-oxohepta-3-ene-1,7-dioic acid hydratase in catechol pathway
MTVKWLPVEGGDAVAVGKILAVGRNYADHAAEMNAPAEPVVFMKPGTAVRLPGEEVLLPRNRGAVHHEIELVASLRDGGSNVSEQDAARMIGAYGLGLDLTLRDVQGRAKAKGGPWTLAKGFDGSLPLSPFLAAEAVVDPAALRFRLLVNGGIRQEGRASDMLLSIPAIIAFISSWITLEPGDLILSGTPAGVGPVEPGDEAVMVLEDRFEARVRFC